MNDNPKNLAAVDRLLDGMWNCIYEDAGAVVELQACPEPTAEELVEAALWVAEHMLWLATTDGVDAGRSERWRKAVERLAMKAGALRDEGPSKP